MLAIGIDYNVCGTLNPKLLEAFIKAHTNRIKEEREITNINNYYLGQYIMCAIGTVMGGGKYPDKPFDLFNNEPDRELSAEEIRQQNELAMQRLNFNMSRLKQVDDTQAT